jgi:transposase
VIITVVARRFRCAANDCPRKVFTEPMPSVAASRARRTSRLAEIQRHVGLALGGAAGARLTQRLGLPVSGSTLLRLVRGGMRGCPGPQPRVIGIDDWAWRRGHRYGSIVCDLERRRIVDLLPDRTAATVEDWLSLHPGIAVVARDRGGAYGPAGSRACPGALQVADRWHLFENASAAMLEAVRKSIPNIRAALGVTTIDPSHPTAAERRQHDTFLRRQANNAVIRRLAELRTPIKAIVRHTGRSRKLVRAVLRGGDTDGFRVRMSTLAPFLARLDAEWNNGCRNGAELWRRLRDAGFTGAPRVVSEWATRRRRAGSVGVRLPSARTIARLLTSQHDRMSRADAVLAATVERAVPALAVARDLVERFHAMLRSRSSAALDAWLRDAAGGLLGGFANGIAEDRQAVAAAITEPWSNGQTEGQITKLKLVKRQMYGRASLDLLRARLCTA